MKHTTWHWRLGLLRGNGFESRCIVAVEEVADPHQPPVTVEIVKTEKQAPEGDYEVILDGQVFRVRYLGGKWLSAEV